MVKIKKIIFFILMTGLFLFNFNASIVSANNTENTDDNHLSTLDISDKRDKTFSVFMADLNYDFSKIKKIHITDVDTSLIGDKVNIDRAILDTFNKKSIIKFIEYKIVPKEEANVILEIVLRDWKCEFDHKDKGKVTYEAYESFEGYKEEYDSFEKSKYEMKKRIAKELGEPEPRKPKPKGKKWVISSKEFPGSRRVITSHDRGGKAKKISSETWFFGSREVYASSKDIFLSTVTAEFNVRDAKTNKIIMVKKGGVAIKSHKKNIQMKSYEQLFNDYCKSYNDSLKQIQFPFSYRWK